jgi:GDP-L-fucose synthase
VTELGMLEPNTKVFVAGHRGMTGSALVRRLERGGFRNVLVRSRAELDLTDQRAVNAFLTEHRPAYIFIAAAKVGGIVANNMQRADFIYQNLMIEANLIHGAHAVGVERLLFLGSNCMYPRECPQPVREEYLLTGPLEPTNEPYAIAKIAGVKLCESYNRQYGRRYLSVMPVNLYGPGDNYDASASHVLPALIRKTHEAKEANRASITLWGTGQPRREFMHCDDLADACVFLAQLDDTVLQSLLDAPRAPIVNIGTGSDDAIIDVARTVCRVLGFVGSIEHDLSKPDGTLRKRLDTRLMDSLGWAPRIGLEEGIRDAYRAFLADRSRW